MNYLEISLYATIATLVFVLLFRIIYKLYFSLSEEVLLPTNWEIVKIRNKYYPIGQREDSIYSVTPNSFSICQGIYSVLTHCGNKTYREAVETACAYVRLDQALHK